MIMHGAEAGITTRYGSEIAIMKHMGWSYSDLMNTPADLVEEIGLRLDAEARWRKEKERQSENG